MGDCSCLVNQGGGAGGIIVFDFSSIAVVRLLRFVDSGSARARFFVLRPPPRLTPFTINISKSVANGISTCGSVSN